MKTFRLNTQPAEQARQEMPRLESPPAPKELQANIVGVVQTATKANRALIAADVNVSMLVYYASRVGGDLADVLVSDQSHLLTPEARERLQRTVAQASDRLLRTESFVRGCREQFLAPIEEQLRQLQDLDEVVLVTHFE